MKPLATPALVLGLLGVAAGGVLRVYRPSWTVAWPAALIVGGLCLLLALYASFPGMRSVWARRSTRYGLNAAVMILLILGVIVLVEAVSYRHNWRLDLTENKRHSLAPQTVKVLRELRVPVKATGFFRPDEAGKRRAEDLLKQYASASDGKFTWEIADADRNPGLARRYGVEAYGTVVLEAKVKEGQVKEEKVQEAEEERLTNALVRVTREGKRVIYFLKGHSEREPGSSDRTGLSEVKGALEKVNYEVKDLLLARETKVPDDAAILVVAGPQKDLLPNEVEALQAYVGRAGKVLLLIDPFQASGLVPVLDRYGLGLGQDVIIDVNPLGRVFQAGPEVPVVSDYAAHPITQGLRGAVTFVPVARSVTVKEKPPQGVSTQALARTSTESWAEASQDQIRSGQVKPDPGEVRGPLTLAAVVTVDGTDVPEDRKGAKARIVVVGDSDFATNAYVNVAGNRDFLLNTLSWLAEEENLIAVRPRDPSRSAPLFLTAAQGHVLFWVPVVLVPLAMVVAGAGVFIQRRGR
jgi:ABC-type uncharacterized transport system involved in gliding motility auxiliary subunit